MSHSTSELVETKKEIIRISVLMNNLPLMLIIEGDLTGTESGIPANIFERFEGKGIPIQLKPEYPLNLDLDDDSFLIVTLSFDRVARICHIPWESIVRTMVVFPVIVEEVEQPKHHLVLLN